MRVFLGGTCNESTWRDKLIPMLDEKEIDFFNPVVKDWNSEAQAVEVKMKVECDVCLYTITPRMTDVYAIAEVIEDAIQRPEKIIFNVMPVDGDMQFSEEQIKSLIQVGKMSAKYGATFVSGLDSVMKAINLLVQRKEVIMVEKTLKNSDVSGAHKNVKDIQVVGDGDMFKLLSKAYSENEGWMKSTKAMEIKDSGCIVQVTTQQKNPDGSYAVAEALSFVPGVKLVIDDEGNRKLVRFYLED